MIFDDYCQELADFSYVKTPALRPYVDVNWHLFPIRVPSQHRRQIFEGLRRLGVGVQVNYIPAHWHPVFAHRNFRRDEFPNSVNFYESEISMPMSSSLTKIEFKFILEKITEVITHLN